MKSKYISEEDFKKIFDEYVKDTKSNPLTKVEYVGKDGQKVLTPIDRPLTIEGFKNYARNNYSCIDHYIKNSDNAYESYRPIITHVIEEIRQDQIERGLVGLTNANLTARLNGLREQNETNTTTTIKLFNIDPLTE
jgi:hypothetical protein